MNFRFGSFVLDVDRRELRSGPGPVSLEPQVFDLLLYLIRNRNRVVSKDDLIEAVWSGRIVSDSALTTRINAARSAIGDSGKAQNLIRTFPRRGFRFVGDVREDMRVAEGPDADCAASFVVYAQARAACVLMGEEDAALLGALRGAYRVVTSSIENAGGSLHAASAGTVVGVFRQAGGAVSAAAHARAALAELNRAGPADMRVHYRFGIAPGSLQDEPDGPAAERAAALCAGAHPGAVRMTDNVRELLPPDAAFAATRIEAGQYELDGAAHDAAAGVPAQLLALDPPLPEKPSIVLLPFNVAGDERDGSEALAEGLRLDIQNALLKTSGVFAIAAASANAMRGWPAAKAASRTGVRYVLEGTIQRAGADVRVTVQLVDAIAGATLWSEQYGRALDGDFALQDEITERIVTALNVKLAGGEQARIWHKCLTEPEARECFYRGVQAFIRMNRESVASARTFFHRLVELAPASPFGPTWLALCFWFESTRGWSDDPVAARDRAGVWAERAVAMEDADGQAHTVLGNVRLLQRRFDEALAVASEAIEIRPGCANANGFLANVLLYCGNPQKAVLHARRALRFMPVYPPWFVEILAAAYRDAGQHDLGIIAAREIVRIMPSAIQGRLLLASALVRSGWPADASRVAGEARELDPDLTTVRWASSQPYRDPDVLASVIADLRAAGIPQ